MCVLIIPTQFGLVRFGQNDDPLHAGLSSMILLCCCTGVSPTTKFYLTTSTMSHFRVWYWARCQLFWPTEVRSDQPGILYFTTWPNKNTTWHSGTGKVTKHSAIRMGSYRLLTIFPTSSLHFIWTKLQPCVSLPPPSSIICWTKSCHPPGTSWIACTPVVTCRKIMSRAGRAHSMLPGPNRYVLWPQCSKDFERTIFQIFG